jgi:tetratricopeptide (TPR) repeat protein
MQEVAEAAIETLGQVGDSRSLAIAGQYLGIALQRQGRMHESVPVLERALADADAAGDRAVRRRVVTTLAHSLSRGPAPVSEARRRCEELLASSHDDRVLEAVVRRFLAMLCAMSGEVDEAREHLAASASVLDRLSRQKADWLYAWAAAETRELLGDLDGAERELIATWRSLGDSAGEAIDERARYAAYTLAMLHCDRGRWDDAEACLAYGRDTPVAWGTAAAFELAVQARLAAHRGRSAEALSLAESAVARARSTEYSNLTARVLVALAEVRRAAGATAEADAAVAAAIRLYEAKGNVAAAAALRP